LSRSEAGIVGLTGAAADRSAGATLGNALGRAPPGDAAPDASTSMPPPQATTPNDSIPINDDRSRLFRFAPNDAATP